MHLFTSKFLKRPEHVTELPGSVTTPEGFTAAGVAAGLKKSGKRDLGLLVGSPGCSSAALFTPNAAASAPVRVCREETDLSAIQAVIVNSGSANACTGEQGLEDARQMVRLAEDATGVPPGRMAVASTGVIGQPIPMDLMKPGIGAASQTLSEIGGAAFAEAIRTTDVINKEGAVEVALSSGAIRIGACAKGAGMMAPNMATLLAFITTDVGAPSGLLHDALSHAVASSFNSVSVDGDMSTNDCIFLLASGKSSITLAPDSADLALFTEALSAVCKSLALKLVADGEGASKVIEINIRGAYDGYEALRVARGIANSPLVKTAFYGQDANWGRIMGSAGATLAGETSLQADIYYEDVCVARNGAMAAKTPAESILNRIMQQPEITVTLDLHRGDGSYTMYFSDLTHDYVTLNAEYTT